MDSITRKPISRFSISKLLNPNRFPNPKPSSLPFKTSNHFPSRTTSLSINSSNPRKPSKTTRNFNQPISSFWVLAPVLDTIKHLLFHGGGFLKTSIPRMVSESEPESFLDEDGGGLMLNGGIGMALMSTTSIAKDRISPALGTLAANPTFVSGLLAWAIAQSMKVFLNFFVERKWNFLVLFNSGGMPSSHSALCTALTTSVALCHGIGDSLFPVCLGFSLIVMYDATGVRRHAGMQAEVLNMIVKDLFQGHPVSQRKLKELLGHTPSQVIAGAVLGILVSCICCQSCLVAP